MKITHRYCNCTLAAFAAALVVHAAGAAEETYPMRPIRMIVPQSAGGSTDLVARVIAQRLDDTLKQPVVVDNRPGAGSINGTDIVAKAMPDGYTLLAIAASFTITPSNFTRRRNREARAHRSRTRLPPARSRPRVRRLP